MPNIEEDNRKCEHCGGLLKIRNPTGKCDHLYYPENCKVCEQTEKMRMIPDGNMVLDINKYAKLMYDLIHSETLTEYAINEDLIAFDIVKIKVNGIYRKAERSEISDWADKVHNDNENKKNKNK